MGGLNRDMHTGRQTCEDGLRWGDAFTSQGMLQIPTNYQQWGERCGPVSPSEFLQRTSPADSLISDSYLISISDSQLPELRHSKFLLFKPPSPWHFVMVAPGKQHSIPLHPWNPLPPDAFCSSFCKPNVLP